MSEWKTVTLADLVEHVDERRGDQTVPLVLSVTEKRGIVPQEAVFKKRIATEDTSNYKVLQPLDIAYNPYLLWTGAIGQWCGSNPGVTSPVYETFRTRSEHDPRFIGLVLTGGSLTPYFDATAIGSIPRRRRTPVPVFLSAETTVPPLPAQRRIAAIMSAVDTQIAELDAEVHAARTVLDRIVSTLFGGLSATTKYGAVARTRSGPSWAAQDESKAPVDNCIRVVKITNTKSDGTLDMSDATYVVGLPESTATLTKSSLIIIRTNGNRNRIGNVYRPSSDALGCAVSAFQFISQPADPTDRDFLYWTLREPSMQKRMTEAASGTTGLGNLAVRWLNAAEIPWTDDADKRAAITTTADAAEMTVTSLAAELVSLRQVRTDLLSALLSQAITADEAIDQFTRGAA
jgi:restriction endonuclease S subunit